MPKRALYQLAWCADAGAYRLLRGDDPAPLPIAPGSPAWFDWLDAVPSFAFHDRAGGSCTVRKEPAQRGAAYWYAYRRAGDRTAKRYVGRGPDLTPERLEAVAAELAPADPDHSTYQLPTDDTDRRSVTNPPPRRRARRTGAASAPADAARWQRLLLATKLGAPRPPARLVERLHLLRRLQRGLERPLTLVSAPAGFGKTTALAAWAQSAEVPVGWVSLDATDNDPRQFWTYTLAALNAAAPGLAETALAMLTAPQRPPVAAALRALLNALAAAPRDIALVLDDYHLITEAEIHQGMSLLLEHPPARLHLFLASRTEPPLPLGRLRARDQLNEVRADDLRFRPDEVGEFLAAVMDLHLPVEHVLLLADRTDGWAAGVQLAGLSLRDHPDPVRFVVSFGGGHRHVLTYLGEEVLAAQSPDVQDFLLRTAVLRRLSAPLCDAVTGHDDGRAMLEYLERANLFLVPLDDEGRWYRYYHLFGDLLRHRLQLDLPALVPELHRRAARWLEASGSPVEAVDHLLAVPDPAEAARVVEDAAQDLLRRGEVATLLSLIERLPEQAIAERPFLCLHATQALFGYGRLEEVERRLEQAEAGLAAGLDDPATATDEGAKARLRQLAGQLAAALAVLAAMHGNADVTLAQAEIARANLSPSADYVQVGLGVPLGHALRYKGQFRAAADAYDEASRRSLAAGNLYLATIALIQQAGTLAALGRPHEAADLYRRVIRLTEERGGAAQALAAGAYNGLSERLFEWNDLTGAALAAEKALALGEQWANAEDQVEAYVRLAAVYQAQGRAVEATEAIARAKELVRSGTHFPWLAPFVACVAARLALLQGRLEAAARWARERDLHADAFNPRSTYPMHAHEYLTLARLFMARGQPEVAARLLERLLAVAEAEERTGSAIELLAALALARQARGESEPALEALRRAVALAEPEGYVRTFVGEGAPMRSLLARLREREPRGTPARRYLDRLLAAFDREPGAATGATLAAPSDGGGPVEPLSEREREVLALLAQGRSNQEIARQLVVAVSTVKTHVHHVFDKLQVSQRLEAVARARELGLLER